MTCQSWRIRVFLVIGEDAICDYVEVIKLQFDTEIGEKPNIYSTHDADKLVSNSDILWILDMNFISACTGIDTV